MGKLESHDIATSRLHVQCKWAIHCLILAQFVVYYPDLDYQISILK